MMRIFLLLLAFSIFNLCSAQNLGALLFSGNCITCHHPTKTISAPSAAEVKKRYKEAFEDKEEFVSYMATWVKKPTPEGSLMHDAIKKYGVMPELGFDEETLRVISKYIYENDFTKHETGY
ncbi:MAG: cytochrome C [Sulfurimonas sp.]|uniref:c-type cytochrome n=1 Tax=Sulfurimonas sp. TaxID=2022749 RepID=UPI0028CF7CB7|nr:cytochrome C [Sulfurimonas sp.]MDT8338811.1 cytochrome C [Sulfurimonas sp.]